MLEGINLLHQPSAQNPSILNATKFDMELYFWMMEVFFSKRMVKDRVLQNVMEKGVLKYHTSLVQLSAIKL